MSTPGVRVVGLLTDYDPGLCAFCGAPTKPGASDTLVLTLQGVTRHLGRLVAHWLCLRERVVPRQQVTVDLAAAEERSSPAAGA